MVERWMLDMCSSLERLEGMLRVFADRVNIGQAGRASRRGTAGFRHPASSEAKDLDGWSLPRPAKGPWAQRDPCGAGYRGRLLTDERSTSASSSSGAPEGL